MDFQKVKVKFDDLFSSDANAFVIPRSTTGTISNNIESGLKDYLGFDIVLPLSYKSLGSVDIYKHENLRRTNNKKQKFDVIFATSVDNNSSEYTAIEEIAKFLARYTLNDSNIRDIATPLLGTGAGRLDYIESFRILSETFEKIANPNSNLLIYINDEWVYSKILDYIDEKVDPISEYENRAKLLEEKLSQQQIATDSLINTINRQNDERKILLEQIEALRNKSEGDAKNINDLKRKFEIELLEFDERYKSNLSNYELLAQEKIFREESNQNKNDSEKWIYIILGLTLVLIGICIWFMYSCWFDYACMCKKITQNCLLYNKNYDVLFYYELFRPVLLRVFIISIIVLLIKFSIKNYNARMHNSTINMNKANSLAALIRIITGLQNDESKNILLTNASKEIFLQHKTGYLYKDENKIDLGLLDKLSSIFKRGDTQ